MKNPSHSQVETITPHHAPRVGDVQLSIPEGIGTGSAEDTLLLAEQAVADWTILIAQSVQRELYKSPIRRGAVHGYLHPIVLGITVHNFCIVECLDFKHCLADDILYSCRRESHTTRLPKSGASTSPGAQANLAGRCRGRQRTQQATVKRSAVVAINSYDWGVHADDGNCMAQTCGVHLFCFKLPELAPSTTLLLVPFERSARRQKFACPFVHEVPEMLCMQAVWGSSKQCPGHTTLQE